MNKSAIVARLLSTWRRSERKTLSIEADMFRMFPYLNPIHTIHDKSTENILYIVVNREESIKAIESREMVTNGTPLR